MTTEQDINRVYGELTEDGDHLTVDATPAEALAAAGVVSERRVLSPIEAIREIARLLGALPRAERRHVYLGDGPGAVYEVLAAMKPATFSVAPSTVIKDGVRQYVLAEVDGVEFSAHYTVPPAGRP